MGSDASALTKCMVLFFASSFRVQHIAAFFKMTPVKKKVCARM